jgi:Ser/Thr protein kinase RdoA (MazF antagonist)
MWSHYEAFQRQRRSLFYPKADLPELPAENPLLVAGPIIPHAVVAQVASKVIGRVPASVEQLAEAGTFHVLYRARWQDGVSAILRFNPEPGEQRDFSLLLDPWAMDLLRQHGLPALQVLDVDLSRCLCPWDYEVLEEAPGKSLRDFDHDDSLLTPHLVDLGRTVAQLHQIPAEGFGLLAVDSPGPNARGSWPSWQDYVCQNLDNHLRTCLDLDAINLSESHAIHCLFTARNPPWADCAPRLLHGDLGNHNIFVHEDRISALIDWEDCLAGDPIYEVAFWATFHPERRHEAFLQGYRSVRALPGDFEERFWLYFLRVALAKTVLRHRLGLRDVPGRPPASLRIQRALGRLQGHRLAA